jgi:hypothetical protein
MNNFIKNQGVAIIAGPCSISEKNFQELFQLAGMEVKNRDSKTQRAIAGVRVVGLKSRTYYTPGGEDLGIDYPVFIENLKIYSNGGSINDLKMMPGIEMAQRIATETGTGVATEIVSPLLQAPLYERMMKDMELLLWNPAVSQLGWNFLEITPFLKHTKWKLGLKNPKWLGKRKHDFISGSELSSMEKTWLGLGSYAPRFHNKLVFIHRGVSIENSGTYRNLPVHDSAKRVKQLSGQKMFFDPSHSFGSKMREQIVDGTIEAMKMMFSENEYLYDGILIEAGTSKTDSGQHITHGELKQLVDSLAKFRDVIPPNEKETVTSGYQEEKK